MQFHIENTACGGCARGLASVIHGVDPGGRIEADPLARRVTVQTGKADAGFLAALNHGDTNDDPVIVAFMAANERMHRDMAIAFASDADVDLVRGMIPHHQGAIDMARVVVEHGSDTEFPALDEEVIEAQEGEIAMMHTSPVAHADAP